MELLMLGLVAALVVTTWLLFKLVAALETRR
jgi:hypothetical protein